MDVDDDTLGLSEHRNGRVCRYTVFSRALFVFAIIQLVPFSVVFSCFVISAQDLVNGKHHTTFHWQRRNVETECFVMN